MKNTLFAFLFLSLGFLSCIVPSASSTNALHKDSLNGMPQKPGSCYAKCIIPDKLSPKESLFIPVYTGSNTNVDYVSSEKFIVTEASTKWVKKKVENGCLSKNPEDCLVWCLTEIPEESIEVFVVKDTMKNKDFEMVNVFKDAMVVDEAGGYTEWREVVCDGKIDKFFAANLCKELSTRGYLDNCNDLSLGKGSQISKGLEKFQRDNGFPLGQLDFESLDALDVNY